MSGHLTGPVLVGSTFQGVMNTAPVFDAESITLQRRMRFNPLRTLDPESLSVAHDQFDIGILRQAALLWDAMIRRDDTLSFVVPQLCDAIAGKPWGVFKRKNADPKEAARHAAALEYFYDNVTAVDAFDRNVRGDRHLLLTQMGLAYAMRYAVHHFVWKPEPGKMIDVQDASPVPALSAELEYVPLWYFENVSGTLRFLPFGGFGLDGQDLDWNGEWMATNGTGLMFAAGGCYIFKRLTFQDWTIYNERYAQNKVVGQTNAKKDDPKGQAMADIVANFNSDMGIVLYETQPGSEPPISLLGPEGSTSVDLFERFLKRQDDKMTIMFRGSAQAHSMADDKETGISAQIPQTEALELAHCQRIASACRTFIDRQVIRYCFGEGVTPLAYFGLPDMDEEDATALIQAATFLRDSGLLVEADTIAERLGVTLTDDPAEALQMPVGGAADDGTDGRNNGRATANAAKVSRLLQLIVNALKARRTANSATTIECSELVTPNAVTLAETPPDGWYLIAPLGEFPSPEGDYVQIFGAEQARNVVSTFNSLTGTAGRYFKNLWHGLGIKDSLPIFEGHSDKDPKTWPKINKLAEVTELRADEDGLWGLVTWNADGLGRRTQELGALKPSPLFWHMPKDEQGRVYPELIESIGLVRFPNIRTAPVWTQNAAPTPPDPTNENMLTEQQMRELCRALGLPETAAAAAIISAATTANAAVATLAERETALTTANAAKAGVDTELATTKTQLTTANSQVQTLTTERDTLKTANGALTSQVEVLVTGALNLAEKRGAITPAERETYKSKLTTANSAAATLTELETRKAMNTEPVVINGNRVDLTTANARQNALQAEVNKRMADGKLDYDAAYAAVQADPNFAPLFGAMQDPTRK